MAAFNLCQLVTIRGTLLPQALDLYIEDLNCQLHSPPVRTYYRLLNVQTILKISLYTLLILYHLFPRILVVYTPYCLYQIISLQQLPVLLENRLLIHLLNDLLSCHIYRKLQHLTFKFRIVNHSLCFMRRTGDCLPLLGVEPAQFKVR